MNLRNAANIKEKSHRLPEEFYKGETSVAFTLCVKREVAAGFSLCNPEIISVFTGILTSAVANAGCIVPVYCFMPDHQHLIITGTCNDSDIWKAIISYKQKTGFWLAVNKNNIKWQKYFYDHVMRRQEDIVAQVKYILDNPARKGLVSSWQEYPCKGSIGCKIDDVLYGII